MKRLPVAAAAAAALLAIGLIAVGVIGLTRGDDNHAAVEHSAAGAYRGSEPPGINPLPEFALRSYRGGIVRSNELRGRVVVTTFVDSDCSEACPLIVGTLGRALRELSPSERRRVTALAFSVNPRADSPRHIRRFLSERGALGTLDYLVAPIPKMRPVWRRFHVLSAVETGNNDVHSADVRIFDRRSIWVSNLNPGADLTVANLLHDIRQALNSRA